MVAIIFFPSAHPHLAHPLPLSAFVHVCLTLLPPKLQTSFMDGPFGKKRFKYFSGYKDAKKIKPLCIFLPKMSAYRKDFDGTKCMSFLIEDDRLLEKYHEIWE